jgi:hypothetical protein
MVHTPFVCLFIPALREIIAAAAAAASVAISRGCNDCRRLAPPCFAELPVLSPLPAAIVSRHPNKSGFCKNAAAATFSSRQLGMPMRITAQRRGLRQIK